MSTYKIIRKNQFAYGPVTSRNGDKITIALFKDYDKALISQAYIPFKIIDTTKLTPEYLMMWFRRLKFDRYARYKSHGSVREIFTVFVRKYITSLTNSDTRKEHIYQYGYRSQIALCLQRKLHFLNLDFPETCKFVV